MTATQKFIEDAIKGGWHKDWGFIKKGLRDETFLKKTPEFLIKSRNGITYRFNTAEILLDPLAWQAVGKTRGWFEGIQRKLVGVNKYQNKFTRIWLFEMHSFIDSLAEGKTIEQALTINN